MTPTKTSIDIRKCSILMICVTVLLVALPIHAFAQITVSTLQNISFGTFAPTGTGGGTVVVDATTGNGTATGFIFMSYSVETQAKFHFTNTSKNKNYSITLLNLPASVTLTRAGGGGSMRMVFSSQYPKSPIQINHGASKDVSVGGTLTVGAANLNGTYNGSFSLTFNYN